MTHVDRLDAYLEDEGLEAVWFAQPNSFAWLTGGDNVVDHHSRPGVAAAGYDGDGVTVVVNNIEAPRLADEELPEGTDLVQFQWYERDLASVVSEVTPTPAAADFDVPGLGDVDAGPLRQPLTEADVEAYRDLGSDVADAVDAACRDATAEMAEQELVGRMLDELARRDVHANVALAGGSERAPLYRHYTPSDAPLGDYALVSTTANRGGLYASCSRTLAFDPPGWLDERTEAAARVEATAQAATREAAREGGTAGDAFAAVRDAYEAVGYPGEWRHHHQGGAAGYSGREWIATPDAGNPVTAPMAYSWNPTVQGAKSENTWLVRDDGFEPLTTGDWPTEPVDAVGYDVTLERSAIRDL